MGAPMGNDNAAGPHKMRGAYNKMRLLGRFNTLAAKKKKLYSKMDITSPMSKKEKLLNKRTANIFSIMNHMTKMSRGR